MLLTVVDGNGNQQTIIAQAQQTTDAVTDRSGAIATTGDSEELSPANSARAGFYFRNAGVNLMNVNDLGAAGAATNPVSFNVFPGEVWPPAGYPVPVGELFVSGTAGDKFVAREW